MSNLLKPRSFYKPFQYLWAYDAYRLSEQSHWMPTEVNLMEDIHDFKTKITDSEREFLTNLFRFFVQSDIDVSSGYVNNYLPVFQPPEVRMMMMSFAAREAVHIDAYSHLIETIGMPESTYKEFTEYEAMVQKHEYINKMRDNDSRRRIAKNIAVFSAFTEGLQLFSSFVMLLNFPRHGAMNGMGQIITWSIVDETLHVDSMIKLFRTFIEENREVWDDSLKHEIYEVAKKMVELEDAFIDIAFNGYEMKNLTSDQVKTYIRYIADRRLISLGMKGIFKVKRNPLVWVDGLINTPIHTNFFESTGTEYSKGGLKGNWNMDVWGKEN